MIKIEKFFGIFIKGIKNKLVVTEINLKKQKFKMNSTYTEKKPVKEKIKISNEQL